MEWPEITINTPLSEVQEIHKRIWNYVIEHGEKPDTSYINDCVLCEYATLIQININSRNMHCRCCPATGFCWCDGCLGGMFIKWAFELDTLEKGVLAKQIRDIPFKEEGYWKKNS